MIQQFQPWTYIQTNSQPKARNNAHRQKLETTQMAMNR